MSVVVHSRRLHFFTTSSYVQHSVNFVNLVCVRAMKVMTENGARRPYVRSKTWHTLRSGRLWWRRQSAIGRPSRERCLAFSSLTLTRRRLVDDSQYYDRIYFNPLDARSWYTDFAQTSLRRQKSVYRRHGMSTRVPEVCIPTARCINARPEVGIQTLFSNAYWHRNAQVIEIQTRQQLKNNFFHETQRIFMNKFCIWTPSGQRTS